MVVEIRKNRLGFEEVMKGINDIRKVDNQMRIIKEHTKKIVVDLIEKIILESEREILVTYEQLKKDHEIQILKMEKENKERF